MVFSFPCSEQAVIGAVAGYLRIGSDTSVSSADIIRVEQNLEKHPVHLQPEPIAQSDC